MIDLQILALAITGIGIIGAIIYYALILRHSNRTRELALKSQEQALETRQAQLFMQIFHRFYDSDFFNKFTQVLSWKWTDYDNFIENYGWKTNPEAWYSEGSVAAYFEGIGLLLYLKLLDPKLIHGLLFRHIKLFWEKMKPVSLEMRKRLKLPHIDQWIEYLYNEMMKYDEASLQT